MMKRFILSLVIAMSLVFSANAQRPDGGYSGGGYGGQGGTGSVKGLIVDGSSGKPVQFATITILKVKDSSIVTGGMTKEDGTYSIEEVPFGLYLLKAKFIGYESYIKEVKINPKNTNVEVETIELLPAEGVLSEVEVVSEQKIFETQIDKKIFNAEQDLNSKGGTGMDLMRNVPSVDVDMDNNITLRGDKNVQILIDGRPTSIPANVLLQQIPASEILKIEIITNPSAKYDPEGTSGILNIILKKNKNRGFNGNTNMSMMYGKSPKENLSLMLNYKTSKLNIYTNLSYNNGYYWSWGNQDKTTYTADSSFRLVNTNLGKYARNSMYAKGGLDYFLNDKNVLYASGSYNYGWGTGSNTNNYENYIGQSTLENKSTRTAVSPSYDNRYQANMGWQKTFDKKNETFDLDATFNSNQSIDSNFYKQNYYDALDNPMLNSDIQNTYSTSNNSTFMLKADYVLPITDSMTFEAGFRNTNKYKLSSFYSETADSMGVIQPDSGLNNTFRYNQLVYAGYATFSHTLGKFGYKAGIRAEQTYTHSKLIETNQSFNNPYLSFFPSAYLSYKLTKKSEFQLNYSRRINRPNMWNVNPFASYSNPYSLRTGNPFLKPEFIDVYELGYNFTPKKLTITSTVYFRQINNMIRRYITYDGLYSKVSFVNFSKARMMGAEAIIAYNPNKKLNITGSFNYWYSIISDKGTIGENVPSNGYSGKASFRYRMNKGWSSQLTFRYNGPMLVTQGYILPRYGLDASIQKTILNKKGTLTIRMRDIFHTRQFSFSSKGLTGLDFVMHHYWESRMLTVSFNYFFGKTIKGKQKRRVKSEEDGGAGMPDMQ